MSTGIESDHSLKYFISITKTIECIAIKCIISQLGVYNCERLLPSSYLANIVFELWLQYRKMRFYSRCAP